MLVELLVRIATFLRDDNPRVVIDQSRFLIPAHDLRVVQVWLEVGMLPLLRFCILDDLLLLLSNGDVLVRNLFGRRGSAIAVCIALGKVRRILARHGD